MRTQVIDETATTRAPADAVWRLLGDSATWPDWTPIEEFTLVRAGDQATGVGERRSFKTGRVTVHEEVIERVADQRLVYVLLSGLALRDYRAEITLTPMPTGTTIRWHTTFQAKVPGMGGLYRRGLAKITRAFVEGLAEHSPEHPTSSIDPRPSSAGAPSSALSPPPGP